MGGVWEGCRRGVGGGERVWERCRRSVGEGCGRGVGEGVGGVREGRGRGESVCHKPQN